MAMQLMKNELNEHTDPGTTADAVLAGRIDGWDATALKERRKEIACIEALPLAHLKGDDSANQVDRPYRSGGAKQSRISAARNSTFDGAA
jgi:hypothetical protein